jgi:predicted ester cyclase
MVHQMTISAIPDFRADIEELIASEDKVVARLTFRGTHTGGEFMGISPSGRSFAFSAISIFRIADGKIVEHWGEEDALGWLQQLGAIPAPG